MTGTGPDGEDVEDACRMTPIRCMYCRCGICDEEEDVGFRNCDRTDVVRRE